MGPRSPLRYGRCRTDVPRTSCNPSSARLRLLRGRRPWFKVSPPARSARGMRSPGPHSVSAPLRSLQNRRPPDVLRSPLRSGRCRTDVPRTSCNPSSARLRLLWGRCPWFKVSPPARGMRSPGPHSVSAPLRSAQNRHPPDVLQPIFREAPVVVVEQAPYID